MPQSEWNLGDVDLIHAGNSINVTAITKGH